MERTVKVKCKETVGTKYTVNSDEILKNKKEFKVYVYNLCNSHNDSIYTSGNNRSPGYFTSCPLTRSFRELFTLAQLMRLSFCFIQ